MDVIKFSVPKFFQSLMEVLTSDVLKKKCNIAFILLFLWGVRFPMAFTWLFLP